MEIQATGLCKAYRRDDEQVPVLRGIDVHVASGELVSITGPSGVGKSTLLHVLGTLDRPDGGCLRLGEANVARLDSNQLARLRNRRIGFVFQFHHLLPELTAQENVAMPLLVNRCSQLAAQRRARAMLEQVGLAHRLRHKPAQLSGGQQQRVALARALVTHPQLVLADEPTGNLDEASGKAVFQLLRTAQRRTKATVVLVTHNESLAAQADRRMVLSAAGVTA
ncbi:MAG: ABC transporter ATP-binding protein [Myxococcota bacterium]